MAVEYGVQGRPAVKAVTTAVLWCLRDGLKAYRGIVASSLIKEGESAVKKARPRIVAMMESMMSHARRCVRRVVRSIMAVAAVLRGWCLHVLA